MKILFHFLIVLLIPAFVLMITQCVDDPSTSSVDTELPSVTIDSLDDGATVGSGVISLSGTANDNEEIVSISISIDNGDYIEITVSGNWSYDLDTNSLSQGSHTITVLVIDASGNQYSTQITIILDKTAPAVPVVIGITPTNDTTPTWEWYDVSGASKYRYGFDEGTWITETAAISEYTPGSPLNDGTYTLFVQTGNELGNWSASGSFSIEIDSGLTDIPDVTGTSPTNNTTPTWDWDDVNGAINYRYGFAEGTRITETAATSEYIPGITLSDGSYTLFVQASNSEGKWCASGSFTITIDTQAPDPPVVVINDGDGYINILENAAGVSLNISGEANAAYTITPTNCTVEDDNVTGSLDDSGIASVTLVNFSDGTTASVSIVLTDAASNSSTPGSDNTTVDLTAPSGSFVINSGDLETLDPYVILTMSITGASHMFFSNDDATNISYETYSSVIGWYLAPGTSAIRTVYGSFKDAAGNEYKTSDTIIYPEYKILPDDGAYDERFGYCVSTDGNYAVIGSPYDNAKGFFSGSAYIFHYNGTTWTQQAKLTASDGAAYDYFGNSVSISGNFAIMGSPEDDDNYDTSGSAYIFHYNGTIWTQQTKLTASNPDSGDYFGFSVSISGSYAIVGAYRANSNTGAAYIFYYNGTSWAEQEILTSSDAGLNDRFGHSVIINGNYAAIGAPYNEDYGIESGSAYIFYYNGSNWAEQAKLTASDGNSNDHFGYSVGIDSDNAIIGAWGDDDNGDCSGSAYMYHYNGTLWSEHSKINPFSGDELDYFGRSVSINGNYALVGADAGVYGTNPSAAAYLFYFDGSDWTEQTRLKASDEEANDFYGNSVGLSSDFAIIGAQHDDDNGSGSGSAYIYEY